MFQLKLYHKGKTKTLENLDFTLLWTLGNKLRFSEVTLADGVHALDLLLAFPSFRELNDSTYDLLEESVDNDDELLEAAASRGAFYLFSEWSLYACSFSEAALLDYLFGDYKDGGEVRKLDVTWSTMSEKLLVSLVQVSLSRDAPLAGRKTFRTHSNHHFRHAVNAAAKSK